MLAALGLSALLVHERSSRAELENSVFTSIPDRVRVVVPRGWSATDQPSYPGLLLWMLRTDPPGQIVVTSETLTHDLYCSWSPACRTGSASLTDQYACAIREQLATKRLKVGPMQPGPKENTVAGVPSVWFEYDDGRRFLRQALALSSDRAYSLVLASPTAAARSADVRAFDQALRSLRVITPAEAAPASSSLVDGGALEAGAVPADAIVADARINPDGAIADATTLPVDATPLDAGVTFETAPAPPVASIVGPCISSAWKR